LAALCDTTSRNSKPGCARIEDQPQSLNCKLRWVNAVDDANPRLRNELAALLYHNSADGTAVRCHVKRVARTLDMSYEDLTEDDWNEISASSNGTARRWKSDVADRHKVALLEYQALEKAKSRALIVDTVRLCDVETECVEWLSKPRLPRGKVVIVEGAPDRGKTTLVLTFAAAISNGRDPVGGSLIADPADVLFVSSAEDGIADTIRPRVEAAGGDLARVQVIRSVGRDCALFTMPDDLDTLRAEIERTSAALVIIDNLMAALAGTHNPYRDQDMRRILSRVAKIAEETGACIIVIRHVTKSAATTGGKAINAGGGSVGIGGAARVVMLCEEDPDVPGHYVLAIVKCNIAKWRHQSSLRYTLEDAPPFDCARLVWRGESSRSADELTVRRSTTGTLTDADETKSATQEAVEWLSDVLAAGELECGEVKRMALKAGHAWRTVGRARQALNVTSTRTGFGKECKSAWGLPDSPEIATRASIPMRSDNGTSGDPISVQLPDVQGSGTRANETRANGQEHALARVKR
jgi:hypothetical protein